MKATNCSMAMVLTICLALSMSVRAQGAENDEELADPDLQRPGMPKMSTERMVKIVEDLENIVTSPEFKFIDADRD